MEAYTQYVREIAHAYIGISPIKSMKWGHWAHKFCLHNFKPAEVEKASFRKVCFEIVVMFLFKKWICIPKLTHTFNVIYVKI